MMYSPLIISSVFIHFVSAADVHHIPNKDVKENKALTGSNGRTNTHIPNKDVKENKALTGSNGRTNTGKKSTTYQLWNHQFWKPHKGTPYNITYIDKAENLIRLPAMNKYEDKKAKRKTYKRKPKRTLQKIIKKNHKTKIRKMYMVRMTSSPTTMPKFDNDNDQDDYSIRNSEVTTRPNQQKKIKKYSVKQVKLPRYPLPYRKIQTRKNNYKRPKRETRDVFILKDFDSLKFLKEKKEDDDDYNVVDAHIKNYW